MRRKTSLLVLAWFRFWAKLQLKKIAPDIIGITGSAGKTTTRNAVHAVLKDKYRVKVSYKANSESGIPLNILGIKPRDYSPLDWLRMMVQAPWAFFTNWEAYDKYVVEMGIDAPTPPKNMEYLLTIMRPRTGIFLNALPVHTQFMGSIEAIAREKGKLIESLPAQGLAILNRDDSNVTQWESKTKAQVMTFGKKRSSDVSCEAWMVDKEKTTFRFHHGEENAEVLLPYLLPEHIGYALAAALCIALDEDFTLQEGCNLLMKHFTLPAGRATLLPGLHDSMIIDSSYNASPTPMRDMLSLLACIPAKRKIALLGDMRELGAEADAMHDQVIAKALQICQEVHLVGPLMRKNMMAGAIWHENAVKAALSLKSTLQPGDVLLVKGSQNMIFLEAAVEALLKDPGDSKKLCRRGAFWEKKRAQAV